jgi:amidase
MAWDIPHSELEEATIADLGARMANGELSAVELTQAYLDRIAATNETGPCLRAVIETNPDALEIAAALDAERRATGPRGALHGIPVLLKDNIDTADRMLTTAGSLALADTRPTADAPVARKLREAGAILLGKANLSEWANFRSTRSTSGWSARGGQCLNPYQLDVSPCGSSGGSGSAVAANLAAGALGTETDGSILCPSAVNGVVGFKPTVGLTSRAGVVPIAHSQDTVGPMTRTVADAAALLAAIAGPDPRDPATLAAPAMRFDLWKILDAGALQGARLGVPRDKYWGYSEKADAVAERALDALRSAGAVIVDPADIPTAEEIEGGWPPKNTDRLDVLLYEFKADLNAYFATRGPQARVKTLEDLIAFNREHPEAEMPWFGQELVEMAQAKGGLDDPAYLAALARNRSASRERGIDAALQAHNLDALVMPTTGPAWKIDLVNGGGGRGGSSTPAALAGYPAVTVPCGFAYGLPIGLTFMGTAWSDARLLSLAYAFERVGGGREKPTFTPAGNYPPEAARVRVCR